MKMIERFKVPLLVVVCLITICASIVISGVSIPAALGQLMKGSLGTASAITGSIREATPLLILGIGVFLGIRAGLFNIGAEGQFLVGACFGTWAMTKIGGAPGVFVGIVVGMIAGGLWAFPAGWIRAYRGGHEVISTIMLNNIALNLTKALVAGPMKGADQLSPSTSILPESSRLTPLFQYGNLAVPQSIVVGIALLIAVWYWLYRTTSGYEFRAAGVNKNAAEIAGIRTKPLTVKGMVASGAIAGLAGALQVAQFDFRFYDGFSPDYGFDALGVALLAGASPFGLLGSASFFGILNKGGSSLSILSIDKGITTVVLSMVILIYAAVTSQRKKVAS